jgi:hypothetical protein
MRDGHLASSVQAHQRDSLLYVADRVGQPEFVRVYTLQQTSGKGRIRANKLSNFFDFDIRLGEQG